MYKQNNSLKTMKKLKNLDMKLWISSKNINYNKIVLETIEAQKVNKYP